MIGLRRPPHIGRMERIGPYLRRAAPYPRSVCPADGSGRALDMALRRRKSRKSQVTDLLETYLKLQAAKKATKGARKAAKGTAVYKAAKKTPVVKRIPVIAGAGLAAVAALVAVKRAGGGGDSAPSPA